MLDARIIHSLQFVEVATYIISVPRIYEIHKDEKVLKLSFELKGNSKASWYSYVVGNTFEAFDRFERCKKQFSEEKLYLTLISAEGTALSRNIE